MKKTFSLNHIVILSVILWVGFFTLASALPPLHLFHIINPLSIGLGTVLCLVYGNGIVDALKNRQKITYAHLLTIGIVMNWSGMNTRMARWYFTGEHPAVVHDIDFWVYNIGLFTSIWAGLFLLAAASIAVKPLKVTTLIAVFLGTMALLTGLDFAPEIIGACSELF